MHNCYVPATHISSDTVLIGNPERHHLLNVLRLTPGEDMKVFDGMGNSYIARLMDSTSPFVTASIQHHEFCSTVLPHITLYQTIPKSNKMNLIVQKVTEIGVDTIAPIISQRSIPKRTTGAQMRQQARWRRIAIEASKQGRRPWFPKLLDTQKMAECLKQVNNYDLSLLLWENETDDTVRTVLHEHRHIESIALFIGPEGGFAAEEVQEAVQKGCIPTTFGRNILRTETAAIVAVALAVYELRDD